MSKHTPTPWQAFDNAGENMQSYSQSSGVVANKGRQLVCGCFSDIGGKEIAWANAEFIVRSCNSHEALVEALEAIVDTVYLPNESGNMKTLISNGKKALALARGSR